MNNTVRERLTVRIVERLLTLSFVGGVLVDGDALVLPPVSPATGFGEVKVGRDGRDAANAVTSDGKVVAEVIMTEETRDPKPHGLDSYVVTVGVLLHLPVTGLPEEGGKKILPGVWAARLCGDVYALYASDVNGQWASGANTDPIAVKSICTCPCAGVADDLNAEGGLVGWITGQAFEVSYRNVIGDASDAR